eukprot:Rhum_TRINITY_DN15408_c7_g1::Rhum_TRINITY_DN15408_c7_g1_i1::g.155499::m.155499
MVVRPKDTDDSVGTTGPDSAAGRICEQCEHRGVGVCGTVHGVHKGAVLRVPHLHSAVLRRREEVTLVHDQRPNAGSVSVACRGVVADGEASHHRPGAPGLELHADDSTVVTSRVQKTLRTLAVRKAADRVLVPPQLVDPAENTSVARLAVPLPREDLPVAAAGDDQIADGQHARHARRVLLLLENHLVAHLAVWQLQLIVHAHVPVGHAGIHKTPRRAVAHECRDEHVLLLLQRQLRPAEAVAHAERTVLLTRPDLHVLHLRVRHPVHLHASHPADELTSALDTCLLRISKRVFLPVEERLQVLLAHQRPVRRLGEKRHCRTKRKRMCGGPRREVLLGRKGKPAHLPSSMKYRYCSFY